MHLQGTTQFDPQTRHRSPRSFFQDMIGVLAREVRAARVLPVSSHSNPLNLQSSIMEPVCESGETSGAQTSQWQNGLE